MYFGVVGSVFGRLFIERQQSARPKPPSHESFIYLFWPGWFLILVLLICEPARIYDAFPVVSTRWSQCDRVTIRNRRMRACARGVNRYKEPRACWTIKVRARQFRRKSRKRLIGASIARLLWSRRVNQWVLVDSSQHRYLIAKQKHTQLPKQHLLDFNWF